MPQLNFESNFPVLPIERAVISDATLSFCPINIQDSISLNTVNMAWSFASSLTLSISLGFYSLTGSTLSLANSLSNTIARTTSGAGYVSFTNISATQNITPGTWWFGILARTATNSNASFYGQTIINPANAFPGGFIGGRMTDSTNVLPSSYATSDLDITGDDAMAVPMVIISA